MSKTKTTDPVSEARQQVESLFRAESELSQQLVQARADLAAAEAAAGDAALDALLSGGDPGSATAAHAALASRIATLERAINAARSRRREAIKTYYTALANQKRQQASERRTQAEAIVAEVERLVAEIQKTQQTTFVVALSWQPAPGLSPVALDTAMPLSDRLTREAENLERSAASDLERGARGMDDSMTHTDIDQLVARFTADPFRLGPSEAEIRQAITTAHEQALRSRALSPQQTPRFAIDVRAGKIRQVRAEAAA